jgi:tetratricopeptide (TPR) repeat protein
MHVNPDELAGGALLATAALMGSGPDLPELPDDLLRSFASAMEALPRQWQEVGGVAKSGPWLTFAALVEAHGQWGAAWDLLSAMTTALQPAAGDPAHANLLAFLDARRGRVARTEGRIEVASDCFDGALAKATSAELATYFADVFPTVWLGRSVLAAERGNYPEARQAARRVLRPQVPAAHRAQAYQMLALAEQKAQRPHLALEHLWRAYDASDGHPAHRTALLASMSDVVAAEGHLCAAVRGWLTVLESPASARALAPACVTLLDIIGNHVRVGDPCGSCAALIANSSLVKEEVGGALSRLMPGAVVGALDVVAERVSTGQLTSSPIPQVTAHDLVEVTLARGRAQLAIGHADAARRLAAAARSDALQAGFHERVFQADILLNQIDSVSDECAISNRVPEAPVRRAKGKGTSGRTRAVARFFTLVPAVTTAEASTPL